jgi:hypothetical protein
MLLPFVSLTENLLFSTLTYSLLLELSDLGFLDL